MMIRIFILSAVLCLALSGCASAAVVVETQTPTPTATTTVTATATVQPSSTPLPATPSPAAGITESSSVITPTVTTQGLAGLTSGIEGVITIGPSCPGPVRIGDTQCADKPYEAKVDVLDQSGKLVIEFTSDTLGRFKVNLPPGAYTLKPLSPSVMPRAGEQTITVQEGVFTQVNIAYDSGIR